MAKKKSKRIKPFYASQYGDNIDQSIVSDGTTRRVFALGGDDTMRLGYSANMRLRIYAGDGNDVYGSYVDAYSFYNRKGISRTVLGVRVYGESGNDEISDSKGGTALIDAGDGDDSIRYHTNKGSSTSFDKGKVLIDGGPGNDKISYWTITKGTVEIHGGEGDDLIGVGTNLGGGTARSQSFFGDNGDDTFYLASPPPDPITRFYGGDGYDAFYLLDVYRNSIANRFTNPEGEEVLVFALWQKGGITYETQIILSGFELIGFKDIYVPYKHGDAVDPNNPGSIAEVWGSNQGF